MTIAGPLRRSLVAAALVALTCLPAAGCREREDDAPRLHAAASLLHSLERLPGAGAPHFTPVCAATSLLVQQIRRGAEPGVLIAADAAWADALETDGLVEPGTRLDLLGNALVVIAPTDAEVVPAAFGDLAGPGVRRIALADTAHVPAGRYARSALEGAGVWDELRTRVVEVADARAVVALVARGEVDAGITYANLATSDSVRRVLDVPAELHPDIVYPLLLVRGAPPAARDLWTWLQGPEAADVFEDAGFRRLREE